MEFGKNPSRLTEKRGVIVGSTKSPPHDVSRHMDLGETELRNPDLPNKFPFAQGTKFPPHVNAGDISKFSVRVRREYHEYIHGRPNCIVSVQEAGGAKRVRAKLNSHGVKVIGAFIRRREVVSVFPEEANRPLENNGKRAKKIYKVRTIDDD